MTGWWLLLWPAGVIGLIVLGIIIGAEWQRTRRPRLHRSRAVLSTADRIIAHDNLQRAMGRVQPADDVPDDQGRPQP